MVVQDRNSIRGQAAQLIFLAVVAACFIFAVASSAADSNQKATEPSIDLASLSIEDLMNIEVTLGSRRPESWFSSPSAMYVLTQDDIRRSGATTIPDALRLVPGMDVASTNASTWAVSCRGFNDDFACKLLVLMDGRPIYNPLFAGVYWDVQDTVMSNIERIEVIRGPGATMWGANAVNGVINIVTKPAVDTQGAYIAETAGSLIENIATVQYGGSMGSNAYFRAHGQYYKEGSFVRPTGASADDSWNLLQGGVRIDWDPSPNDSVMFLGDYRTGSKHLEGPLVLVTPPYKQVVDIAPRMSGGYLLGRWSHTRSEKSDSSLQFYYDRGVRDEFYMRQEIDTFDLDFQQHSELSPRHSLMWGAEYRLTSNNMDNTFYSSFHPRGRNLFSAFVQDEATLIPDRCHLTFGSKFEHNDYTGFEYQPTVRCSWTPDSKRTGWAAISRAVRTPAEIDQDSRMIMAIFPDRTTPGLLDYMCLIGVPTTVSEEVITYEAGYRLQKGNNLLLDLATFYNDYDKLRSYEPGTPFMESSPAPPHLVIPVYFGNKMYGNSYGFEATADWRPHDRCRLVAGYTYLRTNLALYADSKDTTGLSVAGRSPQNEFFLRALFNLPHNVEFDPTLRYVDALRSSHVPSYIELDARLAWKRSKSLELEIVGQNLLQSHHLEFLPFELRYSPAEVPRSVYGNVTWKF